VLWSRGENTWRRKGERENKRGILVIGFFVPSCEVILPTKDDKNSSASPNKLLVKLFKKTVSLVKVSCTKLGLIMCCVEESGCRLKYLSDAAMRMPPADPQVGSEKQLFNMSIPSVSMKFENPKIIRGI
jgi:hypothetical protein